MPKTVRQPFPSHVTCQTHQFGTMAHFPLCEQFKTIQNQAGLETIAKTCEHPEQIVTLA